MSLIHQPLPEIASSPPPHPLNHVRTAATPWKNKTSLETRGALLPLAAKPKDGLLTAFASQPRLSGKRSAMRRTAMRCNAHRCFCRAAAVCLGCVWPMEPITSRVARFAAHSRIFSTTAVWASPVWEEAKMAQGASWR
ncbi:hypothetical protein HDV63DRAFT_320027 [Trichoderma sp. SZMC 28014]